MTLILSSILTFCFCFCFCMTPDGRPLRTGPNCFSPGVNTSCRTETSAYTSLHLDPADPAHKGWVQYDMHGIKFAMEFTLDEAAAAEEDEDATGARQRAP